ncbi:hypothetical protein BJ508DRAFT_300986 [Ascobolus immersus RN42]|uniref:Uncharacterized protein n=1 Tax=Ascobolus immersus RN42 TaxID=1160509 RepID=A0A3N4IPQ3_ASCIM|nr:hypothetical protein BJ508DRAFT_300986 [Ascobolus immersus RN42]
MASFKEPTACNYQFYAVCERDSACKAGGGGRQQTRKPPTEAAITSFLRFLSRQNTTPLNLPLSQGLNQQNTTNISSTASDSDSSSRARIPTLFAYLTLTTATVSSHRYHIHHTLRMSTQSNTNNANHNGIGYKPKQLGNLGHKHIARDEAIMEADRRNLTKFVVQIASRRLGKETGPTFRSIYTPTAGKVPEVVDGVRMPRSAAEIEAMDEEQLAFTLQAAGVCSYYPANGNPFDRYLMVAMLCTIVGVDPSDGFLENAPANPRPTRLRVSKKQAVSQGFPMHQ